MSDNTILNPGAGGDVIATEDPGLGYKIPVSKIRIGPEDVDGGDVTITNPFPIEITDGYNNQVAVKGASTPAESIDHALVTALSPNSPLPAGNNNLGTVNKSLTPSQTTVGSSTSSVILLSPNAARIGATIFNNSTAILYLILGPTASSSSFTVLINSQGYYETPFGYGGTIAGIWASVSGSALITELS